MSTAAEELELLQDELREMHRAHPVSEMADAAWNMTAQLHIAVRGATWARPEPAEQVWKGLLAEVMVMREESKPAGGLMTVNRTRPQQAWVGFSADFETSDPTDRLRIAQQYKDLPRHGLVFRVEQRTTQAGRAVLLTPEQIASVHKWLGAWLESAQ
jgi:hypothetical protein